LHCNNAVPHSTPSAGSAVPALGATSCASDVIDGAIALKQEAQHDPSPTEKLEALQGSNTGAAAQAPPPKAER
jgi:ribonucleoside-diphosphate reductase alpha chain